MTTTQQHEEHFGNDSNASDATVRQWAERYDGRGYSIIPVNARSKKQALPEWKKYQERRPTKSELDSWFTSKTDRNIAIVTGAVSGNLVDIDLDCPEACRLAPKFLPPTDMRHGRKTRTDSHYYYYYGSALPKYQKLKYGDVSVEIRADGHYTVVPGSTHEGTGEAIVWHSFGNPAHVDAADLERRKYGSLWPAQFSRTNGPKETVITALLQSADCSSVGRNPRSTLATLSLGLRKRPGMTISRIGAAPYKIPLSSYRPTRM